MGGRYWLTLNKRTLMRTRTAAPVPGASARYRHVAVRVIDDPLHNRRFRNPTQQPALAMSDDDQIGPEVVRHRHDLLGRNFLGDLDNPAAPRFRTHKNYRVVLDEQPC